MAGDHSEKRACFRALHQEGCFVLPNPWDVGGARRLEKFGFKALATTGAGYAWSLGREDGQLSRNETLDHLRTLCAATDLPVNADFETGYADSAEGLIENVLMAIETGVAGLSIEDRDGRICLISRLQSNGFARHGAPSINPARTFFLSGGRKDTRSASRILRPRSAVSLRTPKSGPTASMRQACTSCRTSRVSLRPSAPSRSTS